jgi:CheY-like chemotaxis protein
LAGSSLFIGRAARQAERRAVMSARPLAEERSVESSSRPRVLIVEDDALISMLIEDMLAELGYEAVGPARRLERALAMASAENLDLAILDVNLGSEQSFPVAEVLQKRGVPFVFATGYGSKGLDARFGHNVTLKKPFETHQLEQAMAQALARGP